MAQNEGKRFEQDIIKSIPEGVFHYRLRDSAGTWQGGENTRFTPSNICDFIVFDTYTLYLLELKSHKGKSIPFSCIRDNQIKGLIEASKFKSIAAGFIINMRDVEETYYINAQIIEYFKANNPNKKSLPLEYLRSTGILIPQVKKRTRFYYRLSVLFCDY